MVLGLVLASCALPGAHTAGPTPRLRLATYNLNYGLAGDPDTAAAIARTRADVVLLQEVSAAWARDLDRRAWPFACFASSRYPAGGAAILSRLPLSDCQVSASAVGWFPALAATVTTPLGDVRLIDLHLQPARAGLGVVLDLGALPALHRREVRRHLARLRRDPVPHILAGDFNEGDGEGAVGELMGAGYASALARRAPAATTWRWQLGGMPLLKRLDHVLFEPGALRLLDARVLPIGRSDHRPVVAEFAPVAHPRLPMGAATLSGRTSALTPR